MSVTKTASELTVDALKSVLDYNSESGVFTWSANADLGTRSDRRGKVAGTVQFDGYIAIKVFGRRYYAHRLAWFYINGVWPSGQLDHRDRDRSHNAINNLRPASPSQNSANGRVRTHSVGQLKGVTPQGLRWKAQIVKDREKIYLGMFDTKEQAHAAYLDAAKSMHGEFACAG